MKIGRNKGKIFNKKDCHSSSIWYNNNDGKSEEKSGRNEIGMKIFKEYE